MKRNVFISYSSKELDISGQVCKFLEEHGIPCWTAPRNINPGGNYATQIVHAIRECSILVLLASESTNASGHVSNEVGLAFDNKKVIIPFKIEDVTFSDEYLYFLGRKHWIEAHEDMKRGLEQLLLTIRAILPDSSDAEQEQKQSGSAPKSCERKTERITPEQENAFDKAKEIAQTDFSRDEIVSRILSRARKYNGSLIKEFEKAEKFEKMKALAGSFMKQSIRVLRYNKPKLVDNCVDYLVSELLGDDDAEVIKMTGLPGGTKNILMQMSFYKTLMEFKNDRSNYLPFYISLGYYEKASYDKASVYEQVKALMTKEMAEFLTFVHRNQNVTPILFVDEIREHNVGKIALENVLLDILKAEKIYKRVVSIDCGLIKNKSRLKRVVPIVSERVSAFFESYMVDSHNECEAKSFITAILEFFDYDVTAGEVFAAIKKLKYQEIDVFIVCALAKEIISSPGEISSISDMYERWALTELYGDEDRLLKIANSAASYIFDEDFQLDNVNFNDSQWTLIHTHQTYLDLLISYHFIKRIDEYDEETDFDCDFFSIMLTASTDMFISSFLKENYALQEKLHHIVTSRYESFGVMQKSSAAFWLGKLTYKNLRTSAAVFLKEKFEVLKPLAKKHDNTTQENYDNQFCFRAICYTLIGFEQAKVLDDYLCLLITNDSANAINRGAMVEYYGDQYQMAANESYYLDSATDLGGKAIKALMWKVNGVLTASVKGYPEKDMMNLSSLLQTRIQSNESQNIACLRDWVSEMIAFLKKYRTRPQSINSEKIEFYFDSVYDDFTLFLQREKGFDISQEIYNTLRNLKDVKRKQWAKCDIPDPESISEHTYSAWMLAMLFLPEELNYEEYSKREVLDMLLIHDMAEAIIGDQVMDLSEPTKELREQNRIMRKLLVKGSYPNIANLTYYYNVWTGYYNGININSKIARDINLIQSVYTFCEYFTKYPEHFNANERKRWLFEKEKLETDTGYSIFEKLVENNMDFYGGIREEDGH